MAKNILEDALNDAKVLQETAIENAKNVLAEAISPQIKEFMNSQLGGPGLTNEMPLDPSSLDPELLKKLLAMLAGGAPEPSMDPMGMDQHGEESPFGDEEEEIPESGMYEAQDCDDNSGKEKEDDNMEETVKIDEADLAQAWAEVVKEESLEEAQVPSPSVSQEFADAQNPNKNAKGGLGEKGAPGERGLEDKEKEEMWKDHEAPAAQDWTVKEHMYRKQIELLGVENKKLKTENSKLNLGVEQLHRKLTETNLFNGKLMFTNKLLQNVDLTNEQKISVIESFDRAESLREVELIYKSLSESFKIAGVLSEGKQPSNKRARSSRFTTSATANMLKESNEEKPVLSEEFARMQTLAGVLGD